MQNDLILQNPGVTKFPRFEIITDEFGKQVKRLKVYKLQDKQGNTVSVTLQQSFEKIGDHWYAIKPRDPNQPKMHGTGGSIKPVARIATNHLLSTAPNQLQYDFVQKSSTASINRSSLLAMLYHNEAVAIKNVTGELTDEKRCSKGNKIKFKLVKKYIPGENIYKLLQKNPHLCINRRLELCCAIIQLVENHHIAGIIHNDVKPDNIIIQSHPSGIIESFLIDYAFWQTATARLLQYFGTIRYIAPEVYFSGITSTKSDIYSLGVTIAEIFGILKPFIFRDLVSHAELADLLKHPLDSASALQQLHQTCPETKNADPKIVSSLVEIICNMTNPDPKKRPELSEVQDILEKIIAYFEQLGKTFKHPCFFSQTLDSENTLVVKQQQQQVELS
jgi:serine/threonine protein kinase